MKHSVLIVLVYLVMRQWGWSQTLALEHVHVIPMHTDTVWKDQRVIIANGRILKIEAAQEPSSIAIDTLIIASGKFLIPGLVETHYHLQNDLANEFKLLVAHGITSARNMAEYEGQDQIAVREKASSGSLLAPRYYTTGPYLRQDHLPHIDSVTSVIEYHKKRGYDFLKLADDLDKEVYLKLLQEADLAQLPVIGHAQRQLPLEFSLRMKSIAHMEEFMNIFSEEQRASDAFLHKAAASIKSSGLVVSPTLGIFEMILRYADPQKSKALNAQAALKYLPKHYREFWVSDEVRFRNMDWFTQPSSLIRLEKELAWQKHFTQILHAHGVPLMAGSDTYGLFIHGFSLHHELELLQGSGLSPYETLKTATLTPAVYLNKISQSGTISEGKWADLVLLDKNPLEDIRHTRSINGVVLKGQWLPRKKLDALLEEVADDVR